MGDVSQKRSKTFLCVCVISVLVVLFLLLLLLLFVLNVFAESFQSPKNQKALSDSISESINWGIFLLVVTTIWEWFSQLFENTNEVSAAVGVFYTYASLFLAAPAGEFRSFVRRSRKRKARYYGVQADGGAIYECKTGKKSEQLHASIHDAS